METDEAPRAITLFDTTIFAAENNGEKTAKEQRHGNRARVH